MVNSLAFKMGQVIGVLVVLAVVVGLGVFFVIALVKAIKTRRAGWIVAAVLSGLPFFLLFGAFLVGVFLGASRAMTHSREVAASRRGEASDLLQAPMSPVAGVALPYEISLPALSAWQAHENHPPFDHFYSYRDAYAAVIAENVGMQSPERLCEFTRGILEKKASHSATTPPQPLEINGRTWLTYDADATIEGIELKYRYYLYADDARSIQLITWTGTPLFARYGPVFDRIARSFKLPDAKPAP